MATPRITAGLLIVNEDGHVLLVRPTYKNGWDIPGGYVEPGETPADACARELTEELGVELAPGRLLVVDWAPHPAEGDKLLFVFDGGAVTIAEAGHRFTPDGQEIAEIRFVPDQELSDYTPERLARRLRTAVAARAQGSTIYAEHGNPRTQVPV